MERHVQRVAQVLAARGYEVTVVTGGDRPLPVEQDGPLRIYHLPRKSRLTAMWPSMLRLAPLFGRADIIHCHDLGAFIWYLPLRLLWPSRPVFVTFHGWEGRIPPDRRSVALRRLAERWSRGTIAVGQFIAKWYGQRPSSIVYGGVDPLPWGGEKDPGRAVFVGQLREDTGIRLYLGALPELQRAGVITHLDIIGDGPLRRELLAQSWQQSLPVTFHGTQADPRPYFQRARYAFVSGYLTMLEALAAGAAVMAVYDNPVKEDYLHLSPFAPHILMADSVPALIALMRDLAAHPQAARVAEGRAFALAQSWESVADRYEDLWRAKA